MVVIDYAYYKMILIAPLNIIIYNVFAKTGGSGSIVFWYLWTILSSGRVVRSGTLVLLFCERITELQYCLYSCTTFHSSCVLLLFFNANTHKLLLVGKIWTMHNSDSRLQQEIYIYLSPLYIWLLLMLR